jgi:hypothetical protein
MVNILNERITFSFCIFFKGFEILIIIAFIIILFVKYCKLKKLSPSINNSDISLSFTSLNDKLK